MRRIKDLVAVIPLGLSIVSCDSPEEVDEAEDAIQGGTNDVLLVGGRIADNTHQWARDASVSLETSWGFQFCSGTLVSPRVVLTNAHCVRGNTLADYRVVVGPTAQGTGGTVPPGTRANVSVGVIGCATHPGSGVTCNDGGVPGATNIDRDLAALILDQRLDVGLSGARDSAYPVIPARIVPNDPTTGFVTDPALWTGRTVRHVGYSRIGEDGSPYPDLRQVASQHVSTGSFHVNGWSAVLQLWGYHGIPGDSGGGVYLEDGDIAPLNLLAVYGWNIGDVDTAVRLTWGGSNSIQAWLAGLVGPHPTWGGASVVTPSGTVWTGDTQFPPRSEPEARAAFAGADSADPDGDGLVGANDNCLGVSNIRQHIDDPTTVFTCTDSDGVTHTLSCTTTDGHDPDGDGIENACDNCPDDANGDQADCDSNGIGDACELNVDGDGIPAGCDNCPFQNNPHQENCNVDGEIASGSVERGDVCDPNPCAAAEASTVASGVRIYNENLTGVGIGANPSGFTRGIGTAVTGFRWCPCGAPDGADSPGWRDECAEDFGCEIDAALYTSTTSAWRRPTLTYSTHTPNAQNEINVRYTNALAMPGTRTDGFSAAWNMVSDAAAAGALQTIPDIFGVRIDSTSGVFWSSVRSWAPVTPETGTWCTATSSSGCTSLTSDLNSHYWSGIFERRTRLAGSFIPDGLRAPDLRDFMSADMCPVCEGLFPEMFISFDAACSSPPCDIIGRVPDPSPNKAPYDIPMAINPPQLAADLMAKELTWVVAGQSRDGLPLEAARAVALENSDQGLWLRQVSYAPAAGKQPGIAQALLDEPLDDVGRYAGALAVLDGQGRMLYFIGGNRTGGGSNPSIHVVDLDGDQRRIPLSRAWAGDVVAATLDPHAPYIVALERSQNTFRIVRIGVDTGAVTVVRTFTGQGKTSKHSLATLPDGRFVVASTDTQAVLTRFVVFGWTANGFALSLHATTPNRLDSAGALSASNQGVTVAATPSGATLWRPVGLRYSAFKTGTKDADLAPLF